MVAWTRRSLLAGAGGATLVFAGDAHAKMRPSPKGAVILTLAGGIAENNRGASDPRRDGFFKYHDIAFEAAFTFDRAALEAFPVTEIRCQPPRFTAPATFSGPLLKDVLKALGAKGATIQTKALDGFSVDLAPERIAAHEWVLTTRADDRPFGIGGFGPLWLIYRPAAEKVTDEEEQSWPWALFFIRVGES